MEFIERTANVPGRKRIKRLDSNNQVVAEELVYIERDDEPINDGTPINAENMNKGNWRDDDSVSFVTSKNNALPVAEDNKTKIVTKIDGAVAEVWVVRPNGKGHPFKIGNVSEESLRAMQLALEAKVDATVSSVSGIVSEAAVARTQAETAAQLAAQLVANAESIAVSATGTIIKIGANKQMEIVFSSDPQSQITAHQTAIANLLATLNSHINISNPHSVTASQLGAVPVARTITINGKTYDLNANRNWDITWADIQNKPTTLAGLGITEELKEPAATDVERWLNSLGMV